MVGLTDWQCNSVLLARHRPSLRRSGSGPVEGHYDVAVVGGGFTGLSAARHLAKAGGREVVLEGGPVGSGASGRNGGHLNNGLAHSYLAAKAQLGTERAKALYRAFDDAVDTMERIVGKRRSTATFAVRAS